MSVAVNVYSVGDEGKQEALKSELQELFADSPSGTTVHLTGSQGLAEPLVLKITDDNEDEKLLHEI